MTNRQNASQLPPRDYQALRAAIAQRADQLPKRLMQVAGYALDHPDEIAFGTVAVIAASADVQPSALVRFSHAFGYQGFSELQEVFRSRLRERVLAYDERLARMRDHEEARGSGADRAAILLDGFLEAAERSIATFREKLDHEAIDRAVTILTDADTIYLIGLRRSFAVASYISYALSKLGVRNILVDSVAGMGPEQAGFVTSGDAALFISVAPYAGETVSLVAGVQSRGAKIVSITDSVLSPIAAPADVVIEVSEPDFEGFRSTAATMALAMTLVVAIAARRGDR